MAFLDFLSKDIGGYSNPVNDPGGLGVSMGTPNTGITYADIGKMLTNSSRSATTRNLGANLFQPYTGQVMQQQMQQQAQGIQPLLNQQKSQSSLASAFKILAAAAGIGI